MNNTTQTENALVRGDSAAPAAAAATAAVEKKAALPVLYDADARNRFAFSVREGMEKYDTAHIFEPLSDPRYMQWQREFKIKGNEDDVSEEAREASVKLWDDQIFQVENIDYPDGEDWKALISPAEKIEAINAYLAVAIGDDIHENKGQRRIGQTATVKIPTEAFFNGDIATQIHEMRPVSLELEKKYSRIQAKRFKQEKVGGLRNRKAKIEFIPQDDKLGELYDEMFVGQEGFVNGVIPLRFKTTVIHHLFGEKLDQKKSQE
jgi:hypothetical protein